MKGKTERFVMRRRTLVGLFVFAGDKQSKVRQRVFVHVDLPGARVMND
jgi:hypothetical protein